jgi:DNA modification methylase
MAIRFLQGDCRLVLPSLPDQSVNCVVTSPPYYGLRDYGVDGQIGLEHTPDAYVAELVAVFREARRVLRDDGTLWLNLGDSYAATTKGSSGRGAKQLSNAGTLLKDRRQNVTDGLKPKDLIGIPWRVAFALQADGWYLRQDIIWAKANPMPESVRDRCTKAHEYVFLLSKRARYFHDAPAIAEGSVKPRAAANKSHKYVAAYESSDTEEHRLKAGLMRVAGTVFETRNRRSVWTIASERSGLEHFAMMPSALAELCIKAGCPHGGFVLDMFAGVGTTGLVADRLGRDAVLIELNPTNVAMARSRLCDDAGMFSRVTFQ